MLIKSWLHMQTSKRFTPGFAMLAGVSKVVLGVALGLAPSCAVDDNVGSDPAEAQDDGGDPDTSAVCSEGRLRCHAHVQIDHASNRIKSHAATPVGFGPPDLQAAYAIDPKTVVGTPTVAIVDAYSYAALESDLAAYRSQYGLPACTIANGCLTVVNQMGQASPLPQASPPKDDWTIETALDIDMVSAACPKCKILVVQANDDVNDGLMQAQMAAVNLGATVISNSWGGAEVNATDTASSEPFFDHPNIAIFVSAGDDGYNDAGKGPDYPATSSHTIAVGGTSLVKDTVPGATARGWTETAWSSGGSACSLSVAKPAYQTASPCTYKATADISAVGDLNTGVAVYNAQNGGWIKVGGTSASAPFVASIFAATGNGTQTSGQFIATKAALLNDVVSGNNGTCGTQTLLCNAAVGWDGPTGYGTPNAKKLMPQSTSGTGGGNGDGTGGGNGSGNGDGTGEVTSGCSTSGGAGAGAGLLLGLAAMLARRRRRA